MTDDKWDGMKGTSLLLLQSCLEAGCLLCPTPVNDRKLLEGGKTGRAVCFSILPQTPGTRGKGLTSGMAGHSFGVDWVGCSPRTFELHLT